MCDGSVANDFVNLIVDEDTNNNRVMTNATDELILLLYSILHTYIASLFQAETGISPK